MMFSNDDENYLSRAIKQGKIILFAGSGFSSLATNADGDRMPLAPRLARDIQEWIFPGEEDAEAGLDVVYESLMQSGQSYAEIEDFLNRKLLCGEISTKYDVIPRVYWYRIYTTNVDDVFQKIFGMSETKLDCVSFPSETITERDQTLSSIQAVFLNGSLPCRANEITFSFRDYARRAAVASPLYEQFVADYSRVPTVFIGSSLNEPLLWQCVATRDLRGKGFSEQRPKSFVISPKISRARIESLREFNVIPIQGDTEQFLDWLAERSAAFPTRIEVVQVSNPGFAEIAAQLAESHAYQKDAERFALAFEPVREIAPSQEHSPFLLGATPRWDDIVKNLDAPRTVTPKIFAEIRQSMTVKVDKKELLSVLAITGSAGSGKSTVLRRLALDLTRAGFPVYLSNCEEVPDPRSFARFVERAKRPFVILFDNADYSVRLIARYAREISDLAHPLTMIYACRSNVFYRARDSFDEIQVKEFELPNLSRVEIENVLEVLEQNGLLGKLRGLSREARIAEFEERAEKQILVAMREATQGERFDRIIEDEFDQLPNEEVKVLYLCVALVTDAGFRLTEQEFVSCSHSPPNAAINILKFDLKGIVLATGIQRDQLALRHRLIAEHQLLSGVPRSLLSQAYVRVLGVLAGRVSGERRQTRTFRLYRRLINHASISKRFHGNIPEARVIYDQIRIRFAKDEQFWLQYGSLELEANNLELAANYLDQAESLDPSNDFVLHAKGYLRYKQANSASSSAKSLACRDEARAILLSQIEANGASYAYHVLMKEEFRWIPKFNASIEDQAELMADLMRVADKATRSHPFDREISSLREEIENVYLHLAV